LRCLIHKGTSVVDVGANQGIFTLLMAGLASPARFFGFEPLLMFEFWPFGLLRVGTVPAHLLAFLHHLGFKLWQPGDGRLIQLEPTSLSDPNKELSSCNLVAGKRPLLSKT
jgi:hypothetical protein